MVHHRDTPLHDASSVAVTSAIASDFGPAMVRGLAELGPFPDPRDDLSLELGLSIWLHESGADVEIALESMFEVRALILNVADLDVGTEPVPLVGRAEATADLITWASYMDALLRRAARALGCAPEELAQRVIESH